MYPKCNTARNKYYIDFDVWKHESLWKRYFSLTLLTNADQKTNKYIIILFLAKIKSNILGQVAKLRVILISRVFFIPIAYGKSILMRIKSRIIYDDLVQLRNQYYFL